MLSGQPTFNQTDNYQEYSLKFPASAAGTLSNVTFQNA